MILAGVLALSLARVPNVPSWVQAEPVATYRLAGQDVAITLPAGGEVPATEPTVSLGGWNYLLDREGTPIQKMRGQGGWAEVGELYQEAKAKWTAQTPVWHVKVVLFTRTDILDKTADGVLRQRRTSLGGKARDAAMQDIGRFLVAAEAAAAGDARVVADVEIDTDLLMADARLGEGKVIGKALVDRTVRARTNAGGYVADDKIFRGPYQSVFVLHAGLTPGLVRSKVFGAPISSFSIYDAEWLSAPSLPEAMLSCWAADLTEKVAPSREMGRVSRLEITEAMSSALNSAPWISSMPSIGEGKPALAGTWAEASKSPFASLRRVALPLSPSAPGLPNSGVSILKRDSDYFVVAPLSLADLVASSTTGLSPLGWSVSGNQPVVVFSSSAPIASTAYEMLGLAGKAQHAEAIHTHLPIGSLLLTPTANYPTQLGDDPDHGRTLTVTEIGDVRAGHGVLPTEGDAKGAILRFDVKSTSKDPIVVVVQGTKGPIELVLGVPDMQPSDSTDQLKSLPLAFRADGTWQTIQVDLTGQADPGSLLLIAPPNTARFYERRQLDPVSYTFAKATWAGTLDGAATPAATAVPDALVRARTAATADPKALATMLDDRLDMVTINVASRYQKIKSPEAEPALIKLAGSANPRVSEQAIAALAFQGTDASRTAIRNILDNSPFDPDRVAAAEAFAAEKSPNAAGAISRLWAARSWQARLRATELIAALPGDDPKIILLTFLQQIEPEVRLSTTLLADPKFYKACDRFLWDAVNDPSDAVRAASYLQLLKSTVAKYHDEGRKGIGDDSAAVRLEVLQAITAKPLESDRATLRQAVTDKTSWVRAEALRGFARLGGDVQVDEIANVLKDDHMDVQLALVELAVSKKLTLPADVVARLKASSDPEIAAAAKALPG